MGKGEEGLVVQMCIFFFQQIPQRSKHGVFLLSRPKGEQKQNFGKKRCGLGFATFNIASLWWVGGWIG